MPQGENSESLVVRAERHQQRADRLSDFRRQAARPLGILAATLRPNWPLAIATARIAWTDAEDGREARKAAALMNTPTSPEGSERDHTADKAFVNNLLGGAAIGAIARGHYRTGSLLAAAQLVNLDRDKKVKKLRLEANQQGKDTKAIPINKLKTGLLMAGGILSVAPIGEGHRGRGVKAGLIVGGVALGVAGLEIFRRHLDAQPTESDTSDLTLEV